MKYVKRPRYSHHAHTLRLRPHSETSYALLVFVSLIAVIVLGAFTTTILAAPGDPVTDTITVHAAILTAPPTFGATITTPVNGQQFSTSQVDVNGACSPTKLVKVMKNGILAGTVVCNVGGRYAITITLFGGSNTLTANSYDAADQPGPVNPGVTVVYNPPPPGQPGSIVGEPLIVTTSGTPQAVYTGQPVTIPITIKGGHAPYAVYITWGDGTDNVYSRAEDGTVTFSHNYDKPGPNQDAYTVVIKVTDSLGNTATLSLAVIVRSRLTALATEPVSGGRLMIAWPILALILLMILSFWVGELITSGVLKSKFKPLLRR